MSTKPFMLYTNSSNLGTAAQSSLKTNCDNNKYSVVFDAKRHTIGVTYSSTFTEYGYPIWSGSQTDYNNITSKDANTIFIIT